MAPVYNGAATIDRCIESILSLDYPEERLEIIVVDNDSRDNTAEIVQKYPVKLLSEKKRGAAAARNKGWRNASHDLVAFTDADCVVDKKWLSCLVAGFTDSKTGGCGGKVMPAPPRNIIEEYIIHKDILSQERALMDEPISPPFIVTANAIYSKDALEAIDGFDETMIFPAEDADLSWRMQWKGYSLEYVPEAVVVHYHRSDLVGLLKQVRLYGAGSAALFARHRERFGYNSFTVWRTYRELLYSFVKTPFSLVFGWDRLHKFIPALDFLCAGSFLYGKIITSIKNRVRFF